MTLEDKQKLTQFIFPIALTYILSYMISIFWEVPSFTLFIWMIFILIAIGFNIKYVEGKKKKILFILLMILKVLLMLYQAKYKNLPMGGNDWEGYNRHAINLLAVSRSFFEVLFSYECNFFSRIMAIIYYICGQYLPLINCFVFILSIFQIKYIYKISMMFINDKHIVGNIIILSIVWPINFIFSITVLRETPIQLAFIISLYYMLKYLDMSKIRYIIYALIFSLIAALFHSGMIMVTVVYVIIGTGYKSKKKPIKVNLFSILTLCTILFILNKIGILDTIFSKFDSIENIDDIVSRGQYVAGNTAYVKLTPGNPIDLILQTPYRVIMFALSPLPWQVYSIGTLIAWLIEAIPQYILIYYLYRYVFKVKVKDRNEKNIRLLLIMIIIFTYIMFAWGTANFGTAMRHRSKIFLMMLIIMGKVISYDKNKVYNISE